MTNYRNLYHPDEETANDMGDCPELSFPIDQEKVAINVKRTEHTSGSSCIATSNITNYPWQFGYIPGQLVAVSPNGAYVAYAITGRVQDRVVDFAGQNKLAGQKGPKLLAGIKILCHALL